MYTNSHLVNLIEIIVSSFNYILVEGPLLKREANKYKLVPDMNYVEIIFHIELYVYGIVCLIV